MAKEKQNITANSTQSLLISVKELATLLGISERLVYQMHSSGRLGPLPYHLGRRTLWSRKEIEDWVRNGLLPRIKWISMTRQNKFNVAKA